MVTAVLMKEIHQACIQLTKQIVYRTEQQLYVGDHRSYMKEHTHKSLHPIDEINIVYCTYKQLFVYHASSFLLQSQKYKNTTHTHTQHTQIYARFVSFLLMNLTQLYVVYIWDGKQNHRRMTIATLTNNINLSSVLFGETGGFLKTEERHQWMAQEPFSVICQRFLICSVYLFKHIKSRTIRESLSTTNKYKKFMKVSVNFTVKIKYLFSYTSFSIPIEQQQQQQTYRTDKQLDVRDQCSYIKQHTQKPASN